MATPTAAGLERHHLHHHQQQQHSQQQHKLLATTQLPNTSHHSHVEQQHHFHHMQQEQMHQTTTTTPATQQHQHQCNCYLPVLKPDILLNNDRGLFKVYCFIKDFIGASGTSAVAIDNKIEQAMDLVKSHLMIAVREEVEVLKEKISELMDKINQLEVENTILKANMSQETLQQLQMQTQLQIAGSTPTNGSNMITGAPTTAAIASAPTAAAPTPAAANAAPNAAVSANSNSSTAAATPQSNVGSGTATPTTQQPTAVEQNIETTQITNVANADDSQVSAQATNGPMS